VRQAVLDHLSGVGLNLAGMNVELTSVQFNGEHAEAAVSITAKGGPAGSGMNTIYSLEQKGGKWQVTGRKDAGGAPHGGGMAPGGGMMPGGGMTPGANPHGGGAMPAPPANGGKMPSPEDLPPASTKK
jgi:hypothetical protein